MRLFTCGPRVLGAALVSIATVASARAQVVRGTVVDSASGKGVASARVSVSGTTLLTVADSLGRFTIANAPVGERMLAIHTPSLDSLSAGYSAPVTVVSGTTDVAVRVPNALQIAASACGTSGYGAGGILLGKLRVEGDSAASLSGTVSAEWSGTEPSRWVSATADARGRFALCGVPLDSPLVLKALTDRANGQARVRVPASARFARAEIVLRTEVTTTATFAGLVTDSTNRPIAGVEVTLPDLGKGTASDEQGAFVLRDVPIGSQRLLVRHVGYGPVETQLTFVGGQTIRRRITMTRSTTLDSMVVTEKAVDHQLDDFEENKKLGLGHFLTRTDLAPLENVTTGSVLETLPGIKIRSVGPYAWIGSGRRNATSILGVKGLGLDPSDAAKHAPLWDCYALVYLDDHLVFRGQKIGGTWEPLFDINSIPVSQIEAIEYFASAAEMPAKYLTLNSQCGVLVIHTIRYHPRDTTSAAPNAAGVSADGSPNGPDVRKHRLRAHDVSRPSGFDHRLLVR
jgi:CarboxypepD_reg-like domain